MIAPHQGLPLNISLNRQPTITKKTPTQANKASEKKLYHW
jgi:hypothetical protein